MPRSIIFVALGMLLLSTLNTGCVSQKDYDAVVKERDEYMTQLATCQTELDTIKSDYNNYRSDVQEVADRLMSETAALSYFTAFVSETALNPDSTLEEKHEAAIKFQGSFGTAIYYIDNDQLKQKWDELNVAITCGDQQATNSTLFSLLEMLNESIYDDMYALDLALEKDDL
jgi:hypothetical protein